MFESRNNLNWHTRKSLSKLSKLRTRYVHAARLHTINFLLSGKYKIPAHNDRANLAKILSYRINPPTSLVYGGWHEKGRNKPQSPGIPGFPRYIGKWYIFSKS